MTTLMDWLEAKELLDRACAKQGLRTEACTDPLAARAQDLALETPGLATRWVLFFSHWLERGWRLDDLLTLPEERLAVIPLIARWDFDGWPTP